LPSFEVLELLESDPQRELDVFRVQHRRHHLGPNALVPERGKNPLVRFFCSS
jgi:cation-transporting ATPase F